MATIGLIGGTAAALSGQDGEEIAVPTPWGEVDVRRVALADAEVLFVRRHGARHERLSSHVEHRANIRALADAGASAIVGTTVCGVVDPEVPLGTAIVFDDLFFPDNRLPDGSACTFYDEPNDPRRGHLIFSSPFSPSLSGTLAESARVSGVPVLTTGTYAYMLGPRFNSRSEIAWLGSLGVTALSQTAGPEAVLAGELELPYALVGFGVDYANGVMAEPTPVDVLDRHVVASASAFETIVRGALPLIGEPAFDTGFVYRFE